MGVYWNRLYDFKKRHGFFSRYDRIEANSAAKELNITNRNTKGGLPNRPIGLLLHASFILNVCVGHMKPASVVMKRMITSPLNYVFKTFFQVVN